jgi:hypothetical protein
MKVAVGYTLPIGPNPTYHFSMVLHGYSITGVNQVMSGFEQLKLATLRVKGICMSWEEPRKLLFYG